MTRVLHVTECFSTGVSRAIRAIVELAPEHEHHLLYTGLDDPSGTPFASTRRMSSSPVARVREVRSTARELDVDVVHAHSSWAGMYARVLPMRARVVYQPHGYRLNDPELGAVPRGVFTAAERALGHFTDATVALSPQEEKLAHRLSPRAQVVMLPNVPTIPVREGVATQAGGATVVMSGRISPQKDPHYFADVAERVRAERPDVRFVWIGNAESDGSGAEGERRLTEAGVDVTGWVDATTLQELLQNASLYLHTAAYEGFPLSVLDAAALGLPIVVRDVAAFTGTPLVTVGSPDEAARRTLAVLDDPALADEARVGGRELLATMNPATQRAALESLYV